MSNIRYAVYSHKNEMIVAGPFSREELYSYIECEGEWGDAGIISGDDGETWGFIEGGSVIPLGTELR